MKKNYFFSLICLMLTLFAGTAMAESITDVYGKYTFSAKMTVAEGQSESAKLLSDKCDVTISKDASNIYLAYIDGIAGSTKGGHAVSSYTDGQLVIKNMNDYNTGNFDGPIYFSVLSYSDKTKGYNPYGGIEMPDWKMTVDATTGDITIPDFVVVTVSSFEDSLASIVATFTEAKLTLVEKEKTDIPDITGNYTYTHGNGNYDYNHDSTFSPDYTFTLTRTDESNKNYTAEFKFDNDYTATLAATFDGVKLTAPFDSIYFGEKKDSIRLGSINGLPKGEISYTYVKAGVLSAYSGFCVARDSISEVLKDSTFQWFINGTAKDPSQQKGDEVDFTGKYTVVAKYMDLKDDYAIKDDTFTITVAKDDYGYYVSEWGEYNEIPYGGLSANVDADDPSKLNITPSYLKYISTSEEESAGTYKYIALTDLNGTYSDIALTKNADGTYSLDQFSTANAVYGSQEIDMIRFYNNIISVSKGEEPQPTVTVAGTYTYNGNWCTMDDPTGTPKSFNIKIELNEYYEQYGGSKYMVTEFDGTAIADLSYGGAALTVSDETVFPITCTMEAGTLIGGSYPAYNAIYELNGSTDVPAVTITLNEDGTCQISDFSVYVYDYDKFARTDMVGWYSSSTLTGISDIKASTANASVTGMYDLSGRKATGKGLRVVDGKVMFVK